MCHRPESGKVTRFQNKLNRRIESAEHKGTRTVYETTSGPSGDRRRDNRLWFLARNLDNDQCHHGPSKPKLGPRRGRRIGIALPEWSTRAVILQQGKARFEYECVKTLASEPWEAKAQSELWFAFSWQDSSWRWVFRQRWANLTTPRVQ